jgi:hypothetical protein
MLVFRYDSFDPDIMGVYFYKPFAYSDAKQSLIIGGLVFKPNKLLALGLTYQGVSYEDNFVVKYDGTTTKTDGKLIFHSVLNF